MVYFIIATTLTKNDAFSTWEDIKNNVFKGGFMSQDNTTGFMIDPKIQDFKLGNLDSLMYLNEQMLKMEQVVEGLLKKVERQLLDIVDDPSKIQFKVEAKDANYNIDKYIQNFTWDDKKFSNKAPLHEVLKSLQQRTNLIDAEIRQKTSLYQESKTQQQQLAKKEGNLYVKDLSDVLNAELIKPGDLVNSNSLLSVIAVVAKNQIEQFEREYEESCEYVVPGSAKKFNYEDKDGLTLYRVILFNKSLTARRLELDDDDVKDSKKQKRTPLEEFVYQGREKLKVQIREYEFNPNEFKNKEEQRKKLESQSMSYTGILKTACERGYGEIYQVYIHLKRLRLIVDIVMRFGANEPLCTFILQPTPGKEKKVQQDLLKIFSDPSMKGLYGTKEELDDQEDFYPFVYIPINIH